MSNTNDAASQSNTGLRVLKPWRQMLDSLEVRNLMAVDAVQSLPFRLDFDTNVSGTVLDKDGEGTGLTRLQDNKLGTQYQPSLIDLDTTAGVLKLTTFGSTTTGSNIGLDNTLANALETQFDSRSSGFKIETRLVGPLSNMAESLEQAGIYFGPDQDNYVKLVAGVDSNGSFLRFEDELSNGTGGVSSTRNGTSALTSIGSFATINTLDLRIVGDVATGTVSAFYRINSDTAAYTRVGYDIAIATAKQSAFFSATARAGMLAIQKNASAAFTAAFDSFAISAGTVTGVPFDGGWASAGTNLAADKATLYFTDIASSASGGTGTSTAQLIKLTNNGTSTLTINAGGLSFGGTNASLFKLGSGAPNLPVTLAPGDSISVPVVFDPTDVALGTATLTATASDGSTLQVALRGLGTAGYGGNLEPSLQRLMDLFQIPVNVGDSTPDTTDIPPSIVAGSDEVILNRLIRANAANPVTIQVLGSFVGPGFLNGTAAGEVPSYIAQSFGYYEPGQLENRTSLVTILNSDRQAASPNFTGTTSFNPSGPFGLYDEFNNFRENKPIFAPQDPQFQARIAASETYFNQWEGTSSRRQKIRFFPLKNADGSTVANAYVVVSEDYNAAFDANDMVLIVRNVTAAPSGPEIGLYNVDGVPADDHLVFSRIQTPDANYPNTVHDTATLRIRNTGNVALSVTNLILSNSDWQLASGTATSFTVSPNSTHDVVIQFVYGRTDGFSGDETRTGTLTIVSNDTDEPNKVVNLSGMWGSNSEATANGTPIEPRLQFIIDSLGYKVNTGVSTSYVVPSDGVPRLGEEVASSYWYSADPTKPVDVRLLAAYHQQKPTTASTAFWFNQATPGTTTFLFQHLATDGQSYLPHDKNQATSPARSTFSPGAAAFGFRVDSDYSDPALNAAQGSAVFPKSDSRWAMRWYQAKDANGNVIPGTFIVAQDYIGQSYSNYDYQDNIYLISNVRPQTGPTAPASPTIASNGAGPKLSWAANREGDLAGYNVYRSTSASGTFIKINSSVVNGTNYTDGSSILGQTYYYYLKAVDLYGTEGAATAQLVGTRGTDTVAPVAPTGISTSATTAGITLNWAANSESDLAGYNVYSSLSSGGTYTRLNSTILTSRSFADTNAVSGVVTYYRITAVDVAGNESPAATTSATRPATATVPNAPTGLSASLNGQMQVALSWTDNASNETAYVLERKTGSAGTYAQLVSLSANAISYTDATAVEATTYYYRVKATNAAGSSSYSNEFVVSTPISLPNAPSGLSTTVLSSASVRLNWTDNATNETGFRIERRIGAGTWSALDTVGTNTTLYVDGSATPNTSYGYRVIAFNSAGDSQPTLEATATTPSNPPAAPTGLTSNADATPRVVLAWVDNASDETGYRVERQLASGGSWGTLTTLAANSTGYTDTTVAYSTAYNYRVFALNGAGDSTASNTSNVTTPSGIPAAPTGIATAQNGTAVRVSWNDVALNETGYVVERKTGSGSYSVIATLAAGSIVYNDNNTSASTTYTYRVKATGSVGDSAYSAESVFTTPAPTAYVSTTVGGAVPGGTTTVVNANTGDYTVSAGGTDIWGTSDSFRFVSRSITGDFDMTVKVAALSYVNDFTHAALMARDGTAANARNFAVKFRALGDARVTYRSNTGGTTTGVGSVAASLPNGWLRLVRTGNTFIGYTSTDGSSWTEVGRTTLALPTTLQIGMAVSSRQQGTGTTAQFRNLMVSQNVSGSSTKSTTVSGVVVTAPPTTSTPTSKPTSVSKDVLS